MGISRYNSEGYFDPVPQMAVAAIEKEEKEELHKWRPLVLTRGVMAKQIIRDTAIQKIPSTVLFLNNFILRFLLIICSYLCIFLAVLAHHGCHSCDNCQHTGYY